MIVEMTRASLQLRMMAMIKPAKKEPRKNADIGTYDGESD